MTQLNMLADRITIDSGRVNKKNDREPVTNHYIKYYEGKTLLVVTVDNEARTIMELNQSGFKTRSGLLLYRK